MLYEYIYIYDTGGQRLCDPMNVQFLAYDIPMSILYFTAEKISH